MTLEEIKRRKEEKVTRKTYPEKVQEFLKRGPFVACRLKRGDWVGNFVIDANGRCCDCCGSTKPRELTVIASDMSATAN